MRTEKKWYAMFWEHKKYEELWNSTSFSSNSPYFIYFIFDIFFLLSSWSLHGELLNNLMIKLNSKWNRKKFDQIV